MFFAEDRIKAVREMICARTVEERKAALAKVEPFQEADFTAMYRIMGERPMTIRYLDPPLHEFLPTKAEDIEALAKDMGMSTEELNNVVVSLHEFNPMMVTVAAVWLLHIPRSPRCRPTLSSRLPSRFLPKPAR